MRRLEQYVEHATEADARMQTAALEMQQAHLNLSGAQRRLKRAQAEHVRRAGKRPPPKPSLAMEMDGESAAASKETPESAAAWKKRLAEWNVRMGLYYQLNRESDWELADARHAEHDAAIEAREADEFYQETLDWVRSSRQAVEQYATVCRMSRERRLREIQDDLTEARAAAGGMEWTE